MALKMKRTSAGIKDGDAYKCGICGYKIIVDEACGCAEEHVFVCCDKPMKKATAQKKKPAVKKRVAKKGAKR